MIQSIGKLILLLPLLFAGALAAIHAQPHDDEPLRAFFSDAACTTPCFIGIQPGVSSFDDVMTVLDDHPWISGFEFSRGMAADSYFFTWRWSSAQPAYINPLVDGKLWIADNRVQWIEVATRFNFGDLWLVQRPQRTSISLMSVVPRRIFHEAEFGRLTVFTQVRCPLQPTSFWSAPVVFRALRAATFSFSDEYPLPDWRACL